MAVRDRKQQRQQTKSVQFDNGCSLGNGQQEQGSRRGIAAIYARYSTKFQDSIDDQVRECRDWAEANGYSVPDDLVFVDRGKSGRLRRRPGRQAMHDALEDGQFGTLVVFATSRLERNDYRLKQFIQEEIVERGCRAVFIRSGVDTGADNWELSLTVRGIVDAQQAKNNVEHIRAAHVGLFNKLQVTGTITFGYRGIEVEGTATRKGKPRRTYAVDEEQAQWVRRVFRWHVIDRLGLAGIVRRLNERRVPLPPRCTSGRWTYLAARKLLANPRYRGEWAYGRTKAVLLNGKDYVRQVHRDEPLTTMQVEELRIVDDATWYRAHALLQSNPHNPKKRRTKTKGSKTATRPTLLHGLLRCAYHDRPLIVGGSRGQYYVCPVCQDMADRPLFTMVRRDMAVEGVCGEVAALLQADDDLVPQVVEACQEVVARQQAAPAGQTDKLEREADKLGQQIDFVLDTAAETEEDRDESRAKVASLRRRRSEVRAELAALEASRAKPVEVPTEDAVKELLSGFAETLEKAAADTDELVQAKAKRVVEMVTSGNIQVHQCGEREPGKGWLDLTFDVNVSTLVSTELGASIDSGSHKSLQITLHQQPVHERIAEDVKRLWDEGLKYTKIAERVGWNRNLVAKALNWWREQHGLDPVDGREHVGRLQPEPTLAERIADEVMELVEQDVPLGDIAKRLDTSRNTITRSIRVWHEARGLPVPDGRALRRLRNQKSS
ncbi:MAG: recombinase family protein [Phycisphaerae bacterium]